MNSLSSKHLAVGGVGTFQAVHEVALPSESPCKPLCFMDLRPLASNATAPGFTGFRLFLRRQSRTSVRGLEPAATELPMRRGATHFRPTNDCNQLIMNVLAAVHFQLRMAWTSLLPEIPSTRRRFGTEIPATNSALPSESPITRNRTHRLDFALPSDESAQFHGRRYFA